MKILQICAAYKPAYIYGGPTMSVSMLSEQLVRAGVSADVYTTTANGKVELAILPDVPLNVDGVTVTYFKRITKDHSHFSPRLFKNLNRKAKDFDLVHLHAWWNLVSVISCFIAIRRGLPVLLSPRGTLSAYSFQNKSIGLKWFMHQVLGKRLLRKCHIHATTESESEALTRLFKPKSITILPNFVRLPETKTVVPAAPSLLLKLLFFSRIEEKKGLDLLLNALAAVNVPYKLTIAGDGNGDYIKSLKKIVAGNDINDKVDWIGFQNDDKFAVLRTHDLFVLPSYDENFGNAVIESLSVGTPVLVSDKVGLAGYVKKNDFGWICQTNPASIANEINRIVNYQQEDLKRIRINAPDKIYHDFDEGVLVKKYINMYEQLIKDERV